MTSEEIAGEITAKWEHRVATELHRGIADAIRQARREALEEAAQVVEHQIGWTGQIPPDEQRQIAAAIRARVSEERK